DTRYVGTLGVKQYRTLNQFNSPDFLYNGLKAEFDSIRAGGESPLLDKMFAGINVCAANCTGTFGAVGTTVNGVPQTAALQMRSSTTFNTNLAQGNYSGLASSLNTLNYVKTATANQTLPDLPTGVNAVTGAVMRFSGLFPE